MLQRPLGIAVKKKLEPCSNNSVLCIADFYILIFSVLTIVQYINYHCIGCSLKLFLFFFQVSHYFIFKRIFLQLDFYREAGGKNCVYSSLIFQKKAFNIGNIKKTFKNLVYFLMPSVNTFSVFTFYCKAIDIEIQVGSKEKESATKNPTFKKHFYNLCNLGIK